MDTDFKHVMSKRTDEDLIKIVTIERNSFQPLAVEAAEQEIKNRNIDTNKIEQVKADLTISLEAQKEFEIKKVSSLSRFIHFIVDTLVWYIIVAILTFALDTKDTFQMIIGNLILLLSFIAYYVFMETKYQKTIGKFITKTKVVNINGTKPEFGDILKRTFCRLIPFDGATFLFTSNGFHDRLSDTVVIKDDKY